MTQSEGTAKRLEDPFASNEATAICELSESIMDLDPQEDDFESDSDSTISTSLPISFLTGARTLERRRVSASILSTPRGNLNSLLFERERAEAIPKRRVMTSIPARDGDEDDCISTPSRIPDSSVPQLPTFTRSDSLLTRMYGKGTLLGKHPQTPSPGEELEGRSKGFKSLFSKGHDRPLELPDFSEPETPGLDRNTSLYSPIPPPNFGTPPGTPSKTQPFGLFGSSQQSLISSPFGLGRSDDNPFLGPSKGRARFKFDYLSESQWYSDYPHHLTEEYLEELFHLDKRVMFTQTKSGSRDYPDYLSSNFYVNELVLGMGEFSDVLKVQSKQNKEYYAVKRLLKTVQGAMERKHYLNEVRNMWRVEKSPNVLQLLEAWEQKGKIYMRMELCKLGSLKSALLAQKKYGGFDERRTWRCLSDLASGLRAIHDSNIIHLDIKPENVFITSTGSLKIGDFGLSITYPVETKDITEGDKYYVAQELLNGQCGKFSDIFSLGMTIFEIVTNRPGDLPGEGPQWHHLRDGNIDMEEYMAKGTESILSSSVGPSGKQPRADLLASLPVELAASPLLAEACDTLAEDLTLTPPIKELGTHKLFSGDLLDLVKEMMQPAFEQRPATAAIIKCPAIQQIVAKRSELGSRGTRSDEAMSGLLLQSV